MINNKLMKLMQTSLLLFSKYRDASL